MVHETKINVCILYKYIENMIKIVILSFIENIYKSAVKSINRM